MTSTTLKNFSTSEIDRKKKLRQIILSCTIGNALEWYDFALYGYFATIIGDLFFPSTSQFASLMATFGVFAAGFLMRPIGGLIFGYIGDKIDRKKALLWSVYLMAIPTAAIGFVPTYEQIGWLAPVMLTLIRLSQGISMGGGFTGSMIIVVENSETEKQGLNGSWVILSLLVGILLGSLVATLTSALTTEDQLYSWGWRLPFILSIFGAFVASYIRKIVPETDHSQDEAPAKSPFKELFQNHLSTIGYVIAIELTLAIGFYLIVTFITNYLTAVVGMTHAQALTINTISMLAMGIVVPFAGWMSDRYGRKQVLMPSAFCFIFLTYPLFQYLGADDFAVTCLAQVFLALIMGFFFAPFPATLTTLFPKEVRFTGLSLAHSLSMTLFGGTAPLVATTLIHFTGDNTAPALYLIFASVISMVFLWKLKDETKDLKAA